MTTPKMPSQLEIQSIQETAVSPEEVALPNLDAPSGGRAKMVTYMMIAIAVLAVAMILFFIVNLFLGKKDLPSSPSQVASTPMPADKATDPLTNPEYGGLRKELDAQDKQNASETGASHVKAVPLDINKPPADGQASGDFRGEAPTSGYPPPVGNAPQGASGDGKGGDRYVAALQRYRDQIVQFSTHAPNLEGFTKPVAGPGEEIVPIGTPEISRVSDHKNESQKNAIDPGDELFAINWYNLNSRNLSTPVKAVVKSPKSKWYNAVLMGGFTLVDKSKLVLKFTSMTRDGRTTAIDAIAVDPKSWEAGSATDVEDYSVMMKVLNAGVSFVGKLGQIIINQGQITTQTPGTTGTTVQTVNPTKTRREQVQGALGGVAEEEILPSIRQSISNYTPKVKLASGEPMIVVFLSPVRMN